MMIKKRTRMILNSVVRRRRKIVARVTGGEASDEYAAEAGVMRNAFTHVLPRLHNPRSPSPGVKLELTTGWCCMWRLSALTSLGVVGIHGELIWAVPECGVCVTESV